jgi:cadmium resistance protein CadD (predicted permease)
MEATTANRLSQELLLFVKIRLGIPTLFTQFQRNEKEASISKVGLGFADLDLFSLFVEFDSCLTPWPKIDGKLGSLPLIGGFPPRGCGNRHDKKLYLLKT